MNEPPRRATLETFTLSSLWYFLLCFLRESEHEDYSKSHDFSILLSHESPLLYTWETLLVDGKKVEKKTKNKLESSLKR